jgi:hypothetical protein
MQLKLEYCAIRRANWEIGAPADAKAFRLGLLPEKVQNRLQANISFT